MNRLIDELATVALAQHDTEMRFRAIASKGSGKRGLEWISSIGACKAVARTFVSGVFYRWPVCRAARRMD